MGRERERERATDDTYCDYEPNRGFIFLNELFVELFDILLFDLVLFLFGLLLLLFELICIVATCSFIFV